MKRLKCLFLIFGWALLLAIPLGAGADGGDSSDNPFNQQVDPVKVAAAYDSGYRQMKAGHYDAAISDFKNVVKLNPRHAMAFTNMAYSYRKLGNFKRAVKLYQQALAIDPKLAEAHEYMGGALLELGKVDGAKQHLAILETLDPKLAQSLRDDIARKERS
jgi:tetratricopeptide (TPR) repeat protein